MTITKDEKGDEPDIVVNAEHDATIPTALGVEELKKPDGVGGGGGGTTNGPPIPAGHSRFYCEKCRSVSVCVLMRARARVCVQR
mmetsp:Transcript_11383/g.24690  ORF Transcript_11383/g.24690 Transcript_11383/m.24690 type:complete len:84 (-) Transcript_11383:761-1012(-)